ncbi:hypothetical protein BGZ61DRAFT_470815 [Ilyonectria robusta]|uniref:uncharacterized protein n=1 Tax=Ilyonectria robusta TaxID=1079257 RepID=UPI001E8DA33C|nr:uncharacterized protein BGZ61DRAFT_470815 [Ilyonectria robusta]KAH8737362.1 hypothetical protein BGZ61DRAFT_470815 [Ilyonectria robusta]
MPSISQSDQLTSSDVVISLTTPPASPHPYPCQSHEGVVSLSRLFPDQLDIWINLFFCDVTAAGGVSALGLAKGSSPMSHGGWAAADAAINRQPAQNAKLIKCENEKRLVFLAAQSWFDHVGPVCVGEFPHQSSGSRRCVSGVSPPRDACCRLVAAPARGTHYSVARSMLPAHPAHAHPERPNKHLANGPRAVHVWTRQRPII